MESWSENLEDSLRRRVLGAFHRGGVAPGDRLPGIRRVASETGEDHRAVARAYHQLEEEGLVEVRPRSGVYLARPEQFFQGRPILSETESWLATVLYQAWQRGMSPRELAGTLERTTAAGLDVVCVESTRDTLEGLAAEVESVLGVPSRRVLVPTEHRRVDRRDLVRAEAPPDLVVTTAFHSEARQALEEAEIPVVLLRVSPEWLQALHELAADSAFVAVVDDPLTPERIRRLLPTDVDPRIVTVEEVAHLPPPPGPTVWATLLARQALPDTWAKSLAEPKVPLVHPRTVRELTGFLVRAVLSA
ncbi:MAG: GntR family transcriptional regulator [Gemmatimonadota bacterium]